MNRLRALVITVLMSPALFVSSQSFGQDTDAGEKVFKKCKACHSVGEGAKNKIGPQLNGLSGRKAAAVEGFKYSHGLKTAAGNGLIWNAETLSVFLLSPKNMISGTKMSFAGLKKDDERANVIAYLLSFNSQPAASGMTGKAADKPTEEKAAVAPGDQPEPPVFTEEFLNDPAVIASGKELWFGQCTHCHGFKAYPGKAPKLKPHNYTADFVYKRVTKGFKKMPAWDEVFTQTERMAIVAYVKSKSFSP